MRPADLVGKLEDHPFRPFRVHLSDGTVLDIPNAGMVIVGPSTAVLPTRFTEDDESNRLAARWRTIDLIHIVQFSDLDEKSNGKRRRKR